MVTALALAAVFAAAIVAVRYVRARRRYERALAELRVLARHRLANPITVIRGGIQTLQTHRLPRRERERLLEVIAAEAERLERVALDAGPVAPEELPLRGRAA